MVDEALHFLECPLRLKREEVLGLLLALCYRQPVLALDNLLEFEVQRLLIRIRLVTVAVV